MTVYFVGSISGKEKYLPKYLYIINVLKERGYTVIENTISPSFDYVYSMTDDRKVEQYKNVLKWIKEADLVVAEASQPSIGVGYEISLALEKGKKVVVVYNEGKSPHFLEGVESDHLVIAKYGKDDLKEVLSEAIIFTSNNEDSRFNFFLRNAHMDFLEKVSSYRRIPKSVYLRELIEEDMEQNKDYLL